jgi:hypothetical protein
MPGSIGIYGDEFCQSGWLINLVAALATPCRFERLANQILRLCEGYLLDSHWYP